MTAEEELKELRRWKIWAIEHTAGEAGYCEGWAHGYIAASDKLVKYLDEKGAPSLDALIRDVERRMGGKYEYGRDGD